MDWTGGYRERDRSAHPPATYPKYRSTILRAPRQPLLALPQSLSEVTGPLFGQDSIDPLDSDLLANGRVDGDPIGERILVHGRVIDQDGRPVPSTLLEVWQANAGGRYRHVNDGYRVPLDRNFGGCGRCLTDAEGRYGFMTVRPGPYPWNNGGNDWRPAHIHYSIFGPAFVTRLVTQMYFEGDPLIPLCPILGSVGDAAAVARLVAPLDMAASVPHDYLAYRFDVVLRGRAQTPFDNKREGA